ncbi:GpE family phage tail protein [Salinisphaera hydrothermalis]|uniref:GpE family phage tail protein n=1 Tax=Salinisphaera hydrothermalis TaxID=563188 RepID=UPI0033413C84
MRLAPDGTAQAVEDLRSAIALIGFVFHWPPDWLMAQRYSEIMDWRDRATELHRAAHSNPAED